VTIDRRLALALFGFACTLDHPSALLPTDAHAPIEIVQACELTQHRCSRCHPIERVANARVASPDGWRGYVERMRLMPGSGIPAAEVDAIVACLVFRTRPHTIAAKVTP